MPGYLTKEESICVAGAPKLIIRSLLDRQQFYDPSGEAARLGISSAVWPLFGMLWPSGAELAACMALRPVLAGERILEIGCGLALASLVAHRRGADVTASDCHPLAAHFLTENLRLNGLPTMKYRQGQWGAPLAGSDDGYAELNDRFDLIIGSDVLYERDDEGFLAHFINNHAAAVAQVWIVDPHRSNRPAFNRRMAEHGFAVIDTRLDRVATPLRAAYRGRLLQYRRCAS